MEIQIPLNSFKGKASVNVENSFSFDLRNKERQLKPDNMISDFSLLEQYNIERDACDKFRYILTLNPICTNVLFNTQTEVVQFEGSNSAMVLTNTDSIHKEDIKRADTFEYDNAIQNTSIIDRYQAINDTEYSHDANGGFEYHCGVDIFNNHMLRKNGFIHINKMHGTDSLSSPVYNTIADYLRDGEGNIVYSKISPVYNRNQNTRLHLYTLDNCKSLKDAYLQNIEEDNGWVGFKNVTNIDVENNSGDTVMINSIFANKKPCEFVDLYPDRTLFSFIPKYNKYRKRAENNWEYCITYPYAIDYDMFNIVFGGENQTLKAIAESGMNISATNVLFCRSMVRHNLSKGDRVSVYYYNSDGETSVFEKYKTSVEVFGIGDVDGSESDFVFSVKCSDVDSILDYLLNGGFFFKKLVNGIECDYYFRKYKKIKKFDENGERTRELDSDLNKCGFSENIYGDGIAQIIFTDDIDLNGLVDHRGRKVTETYFTVIKNNKGNNLWYKNHFFGSENVEYSHCFGPITSGLYFGDNANAEFDYNIRYLHNVEIDTEIADRPVDDDSIRPYQGDIVYGKGDLTLGDGVVLDFIPYSALGETILRGVPKKIEDNITIDNDEFYGDVVEFDYYNYAETQLSPVLHRFNTVQREWIANKNYASLRYDKLIYDDFDLKENGDSRQFTIQASDMSVVKYNNKNYRLYSNVRPEGYFYNPHTLISVGEESEMTTRVKGKRINFSSSSGYYDMDTDKTTVSFVAPINYGFYKHTNIALYDAGGRYNGKLQHVRTIWGEVVDIKDNKLTIVFDGDVFNVMTQITDINEVLNPNGEYKERYTFYWSKDGVPTYANFVPQISSFVWKSVVPPSKMSNDMELFDTPFANGRFYIEKDIRFYNRRQDADGRFGLLFAKNPILTPPTDFFSIEGDTFNTDQAFDFYNNINNVCY